MTSEDDLTLIDELFANEGHEEDAAAAESYRPPFLDGDGDVLSALVLTPDEQVELLRALEGGDDDAANESFAAIPSTPSSAPLQMTPQQQPKKRKRQSDEVRYLAHRVRHLEAQLSRLRHQQHALTTQTVAAVDRLQLLPLWSQQASMMLQAGALSRTALWERIAAAERNETRSSMLENARLRSQFESQLLVARRLEALYLNQFSFAVMDAAPDTGYLSTCTRLDARSDDAAAFASLGRDFDLQYAQTDAVLASCGLAAFEGEMQREMQLKRDESGQFCLESTLSKLTPLDVHTIDRIFWRCMSSEQLQTRHSVYQIRHVTSDAIFTKSVDPLHLPHASPTTLTMWIAMKRYMEEHRVVAVCEAVIAMTGSVSMRLRERSWNVLRPASSSQLPAQGPASLVQTCVRVAPEIGGSFAPHEIAIGTLTNLIIGSYHRHKELMHQVAENLLMSQLAGVRV